MGRQVFAKRVCPPGVGQRASGIVFFGCESQRQQNPGGFLRGDGSALEADK